jgi:hypothetical protein
MGWSVETVAALGDDIPEVPYFKYIIAAVVWGFIQILTTIFNSTHPA